MTTGTNWLETITAFLTVNLNLAIWGVFISNIVRKKTNSRRSHENHLISRLVKKCGSGNQKPPIPLPPYHTQQLCLVKQIQKSKLKGEFGYVSNIINRI